MSRSHATDIDGREDQGIIDDYIANMADYPITRPAAEQSSLDQSQEGNGQISFDAQSTVRIRSDVAEDTIAVLNECEQVTAVPKVRWNSEDLFLSDIPEKAIQTSHERESMPEEFEGRREPVEKTLDDLFTSASSSEDEFDRSDEESELNRRIERMSDERVARLFAKQEEFGIDDDELIIFDADTSSESDDENITPQRTTASGRRRRRRRAVPGSDPFEILLNGDDYGDFDPTDRSRPSIMNPRWKSDPFSWPLDDQDQAQKLAAAWEKDRQKKSMKKREREELRAQGLLNPTKKNKSGDRFHSEPFNSVQFGDTLESFMDDDTKQQLQLPPMVPEQRKLVHELAHKFNLKSVSHGSGNNRYTVLYKTGRTLHFDDHFFERLCRQLISKYDRAYAKTSRTSQAPIRREPGYRNGEVVGASAPEIGVSNRGHKMLEKMGWAKGQSLGALNDGVLLPIPHVMRNTRAGLGG